MNSVPSRGGRLGYRLKAMSGILRVINFKRFTKFTAMRISDFDRLNRFLSITPPIKVRIGIFGGLIMIA